VYPAPPSHHASKEKEREKKVGEEGRKEGDGYPRLEGKM
jgi:hypothetical protein